MRRAIPLDYEGYLVRVFGPSQGRRHRSCLRLQIRRSISTSRFRGSTARVGQELASRRRITPGEAYLAGLLHDFGSIAVLSSVEELSKEVTLPTLPELEWRALVDKLRLSFGASIAARWKLPDVIASVIACGNSTTPLVDHVALVDRVVAQLDAGGLADAGELSLDERAAIEAALPEIVAQMALYTHTMMPKHSSIAAPAPSK